MSKGYKMVFIDLDGTTLNNRSEVTPRTKRVLEHLDANGIPVVITSGRSIYSIRTIFSSSQIQSPVITLNGTVTYNHLKGEVMDYEAISDNLIEEFLSLCKENRELDNLLLDGLKNYYALQVDEDFVNTFIRARREYPELIHYDYRFDEPITNLLIRSLQYKDSTYEWFRERLDGKFRLVNSNWNWIEVINPKVNKGTAIAKLARAKGISLDEVVAFGDEWNDCEMIQNVGLGIAMENGNPEIKAIADLIAPSNEEEGVAKMLEEIFFDRLVESKYEIKGA